MPTLSGFFLYKYYSLLLVIIITSLSFSCAFHPDPRFLSTDQRSEESLPLYQDNESPLEQKKALDGEMGKIDETKFSRFKDEINRFWHAPYLWGGASPDGTDCSGLVYTIFKNALDIKVPRSTIELFAEGKSISERELGFTDLVFFNLITRRQPDHVGIYITKGYFLHASVSHGVILSHLNDPPFFHHYAGARRY